MAILNVAEAADSEVMGRFEVGGDGGDAALRRQQRARATAAPQEPSEEFGARSAIRSLVAGAGSLVAIFQEEQIYDLGMPATSVEEDVLEDWKMRAQELGELLNLPMPTFR